MRKHLIGPFARRLDLVRSFRLFDALEPRLLMSRATGADISQYQGTMNWTTYKNAGTSFAFIRASSSDFGANADANGNATDTKFTTNASAAKTAGTLYGVYHFGDPTNTLQTAAQQADYFLSVAQSRMVGGYLPPVLDLEKGGGTLTVSALSSWANTFCQTIYNAIGVKPFIYCNTNYAQNYLSTTVNQWPLWIANWTTTAYGNPVTGTGSPPVGNSTHGWTTGNWKFWQYADNGTGSNYGASSTAIDLDVYNGDATALQSMVIGGPKAAVTYNNGVAIADNQTNPVISFGAVNQGTLPTPSITFTVRNAGTFTLTLSNLDVPAGFNVVEGLSASLAPSASDTFTVEMLTSSIGTKSGQISFTTNDADRNPFNFSISGTVNAVDTIPPVINTGGFNWNTTTQSIAFQISENVSASLQSSDLVLANVDTNEVVDPSVFSATWAVGNQAVFTFPGYASSHFAALPSGNYRATMPAGSVQDAAGNANTADYSFDFFFLDADATRDRRVDLSDFTLLAGSFNGTGKTFAQGDLDYDGVVDLTDFTILASNFNVTLPAPATAAVAAAPLRIQAPIASGFSLPNASPTLAASLFNPDAGRAGELCPEGASRCVSGV